MPLGFHLNFTDPDGIALEFQAPNGVYLEALAELRTSEVSDDEVRRRAAELLAQLDGRSPSTSSGHRGSGML